MSDVQSWRFVLLAGASVCIWRLCPALFKEECCPLGVLSAPECGHDVDQSLQVLLQAGLEEPELWSPQRLRGSRAVGFQHSSVCRAAGADHV